LEGACFAFSEAPDKITKVLNVLQKVHPISSHIESVSHLQWQRQFIVLIGRLDNHGRVSCDASSYDICWSS
jgi:hypothetical protein